MNRNNVRLAINVLQRYDEAGLFHSACVNQFDPATRQQPEVLCMTEQELFAMKYKADLSGAIALSKEFQETGGSTSAFGDPQYAKLSGWWALSRWLGVPWSDINQLQRMVDDPEISRLGNRVNVYLHMRPANAKDIIKQLKRLLSMQKRMGRKTWFGPN